MVSNVSEFAYYYPYPLWREGDWIKTLLLFFDGIAVLLPNYARDRVLDNDPYIAQPLLDGGHLRILEAETFITGDAAVAMANVVLKAVEAGQLDDLTVDKQFHAISYSRLGFSADAEAAEILFQELEKRGLAVKAEGHALVHPELRLAIFLVWAQLLRPNGRTVGLDLQPTTDQPDVVRSLRDLLNLPSFPSAGGVVTADSLSVGIDLSGVPLPEVLDFRDQHRESYRSYMRNVRRFVIELGAAHPEERSELMGLRKEEIRDEAASLRALGRSAWRRPARIAVGCLGAAWRVMEGDPLGAALSVGSIALAGGEGAPAAGAYNYLVEATGN